MDEMKIKGAKKIVRLLLAGALPMTLALGSASEVSAYARGLVPGIVDAYCQGNFQLYIDFDEAAGKPVKWAVTEPGGNTSVGGGRVSAKATSNGGYGFPVSSCGAGYLVILYNRAGQSTPYYLG